MNKERLLKIADHLEHGQMGHEVFDYSVFNIYIVTRFFNGKNWFWKVKESNVHIKDEEILHWMPLPNPMYYKKSK